MSLLVGQTPSRGLTQEEIEDFLGTSTLTSGTGAAFVYDDSANTITVNSTDGEIVHDDLSGFVANEHIDHTSVTLTAGAGLTGTGDISASRTFDVVAAANGGLLVNADSVQLDINSLAIDTIAAGDFVAFEDIGGGLDNKITFANFEGTLNHDNLTGFVANEHIDHTSVTLTAGAGLTGTGDISASRTFDVIAAASGGLLVSADDMQLDINSLAETAIATGDFLAFEDIGGGLDKKITFTNLEQSLSIKDFFNGTFKESFDALVTSDGATITLTVTNSVSGDLTTQFSSGESTFTGGSTITLTAGSDTSPQENYIYILESAPGTLVKSTSDWPATEHIKIGFFFAPSATHVQSEGVYINQNWNDHHQGTNSQGHLSHMAERSRRDGAYYFSGIDPNGTDQDTNSSYFHYVGASESYFKATSGVCYQMHKHTIPAFDTSGAADDFHVINWNGSNYRETSNLADIVADSAGNSLSNKYFNLFFFAVGNKTGEYAPMMCKLPSGSYVSQTSAENDVDGFDDLAMPRQFALDSSTGVPICRLTLRWSGGTTTLTHISTTDLRTEGITAGAGASGTTTNFADNQFTVFDEADNTKILAFDVGTNVTTSTTRTLIIPDTDSTILTSDGTTALDGAWNMGGQILTNVNIDSGDISAATISGGLTWSAAQDLGSQNLTNVDIDSGTVDNAIIGGGTPAAITGTTIDANTDFTVGDTIITDGVITDATGIQFAAALDFNNENMTNVDIDSGAIDGTTIGATTETTIVGSTIDATTDFTVGGTVITDNTITDDGTLVINSTTATSFSDGNITNVGQIALDDITADAGAGGEVTINTAEADINTRIAATSSTNALFVQGSDGALGINNAAPSKPFHFIGSDGAVPSFPGSIGGKDLAVFENNHNMNVSIVAGAAKSSSLRFYESGTAANNAYVGYNHNTDQMDFAAGGSTIRMVLDATGLRISPGGATSATDMLTISNGAGTTSFLDISGATSDANGLRIQPQVTNATGAARGLSVVPRVDAGAAGTAAYGIQTSLQPQAALAGTSYGTLAISAIEGTNAYAVTTFIPMFFRLNTGAGYTGALTTADVFRVSAPVLNGSSPATIAGLTIQNQGDAGTTTSYGLKIDAQSASSTFWGLYVAGASSPSYFQGSVEFDGDINHDGTNVGLFGATPVNQAAGMTAQLTSITHTAPSPADFAIQDLVAEGGAGNWGFATQDEGNTVLQVIANLQARVAELEAGLDATTGIGVFA